MMPRARCRTARRSSRGPRPCAGTSVRLQLSRMPRVLLSRTRNLPALVGVSHGKNAMARTIRSCRWVRASGRPSSSPIAYLTSYCSPGFPPHPLRSLSTFETLRPSRTKYLRARTIDAVVPRFGFLGAEKVNQSFSEKKAVSRQFGAASAAGGSVGVR